jgi:hypothetical protein
MLYVKRQVYNTHAQMLNQLQINKVFSAAKRKHCRINVQMIPSGEQK